MPITVPRASITQSADDLKARDMIFCRFPEVDMVVGKAGRAETPTTISLTEWGARLERKINLDQKHLR